MTLSSLSQGKETRLSRLAAWGCCVGAQREAADVVNACSAEEVNSPYPSSGAAVSAQIGDSRCCKQLWPLKIPHTSIALAVHAKENFYRGKYSLYRGQRLSRVTV